MPMVVPGASTPTTSSAAHTPTISRSPSFRASMTQGGISGRVTSFVTRNSVRSPETQPNGSDMDHSYMTARETTILSPVQSSKQRGTILSATKAGSKPRTPQRPIDPYEYIEEYEGAGAHTLLGILDFVFAGETAGFCEEDRREWKSYIDPSPPPSPDIITLPVPRPDTDTTAEADSGAVLVSGEVVATTETAAQAQVQSEIEIKRSSSIATAGDEGSVASAGDGQSVSVASGTSQRRTLFGIGMGDSVASKGSSSMKSAGNYEEEEDDEYEMERKIRKEHRRQLRETRREQEKAKQAARDKPKSWYTVISSIRNRSVGPGDALETSVITCVSFTMFVVGVLFGAAKEQEEAPVAYSPNKFTSLSAVGYVLSVLVFSSINLFVVILI